MPANKDVINYSETLKHMRNEAGFTQQELAKLLNMPHQTYSNYERGHNKITMEKFLNIAKICEFEVTMTIKDSNNNKIISIELEK